jgi:hypothetical protein
MAVAQLNPENDGVAKVEWFCKRPWKNVRVRVCWDLGPKGVKEENEMHGEEENGVCIGRRTHSSNSLAEIHHSDSSKPSFST